MDKGGRPRTIDSPEQFDELVQDYREQCQKGKVPMTFTGMALHLGFVSRQSLYDYANYDGFSDSVKKAQSLIEAQYEARLFGNGQVAGAIFALKNHGWTDRQIQEHTGDGGGPLEVSVVRKVVTAPSNRIAEHIGANGNGSG